MLTLIISSMDTILKILIVFLLILILFKRWKRKDIPLSELGKDGISYLIRRRFAVFLVLILAGLPLYMSAWYIPLRGYSKVAVSYTHLHRKFGSCGPKLLCAGGRTKMKKAAIETE